MHGTAPLVRSTVSAIGCQSTKIPHLNFHIIRRSVESQRLKRRSYGRGLRQSRCWSTSAQVNAGQTITLPFGSSSILEADPHDTTSFETLSRRSIAVGISPSENVVVGDETQTAEKTGHAETSDISKIIEEGHPDRILLALTHSTIGDAFIRRASEDEFDRAFTAVDPEVLIGPLKKSYRFYHPEPTPALSSFRIRPIEKQFKDLSRKLDFIVTKRENAGFPLSLNVWRHVLKCAACIGDASIAENVLTVLIPAQGQIPDLQCFNHYLEALNWNRAFGNAERFNLRNDAETLKLRSRKKRPEDLRGYGVASERDVSPAQSIRAKALEIFKQMATRGITGDEGTFANLMVAMAREGDVDGVKSILKSVWNVDTSLLDTYDEEEVESPTFYDEYHPLKPSEKLLFTVVHCFAINNDMSMAWKLLDYMSRNYNLEIPTFVWSHLFEWTYVFSRPRWKHQRLTGQKEGQLPVQVLENLFSTMTDAPHNITPDAVMLNLLARTWRHRRHPDNSRRILRQSENALREDIALLNDMGEAVLMVVKGQDFKDDGFLSAEFLTLRRQYLNQSLEVCWQLLSMMKEVRNVILEDEWPGSGKQSTWARRKLPALIEEFRPYLPDVATYKTQARCQVELQTADHRHAVVLENHLRHLEVLGLIQTRLDIADESHLTKNMKVLPQEVERMLKGKHPSNWPVSPREHCPTVEK